MFVYMIIDDLLALAQEDVSSFNPAYKAVIGVNILFNQENSRQWNTHQT